MGSGASTASSNPKKVSADRAAGSAEVLSVLESNIPDEDAAASIVALRKIDPNFKMNLMYHDEDGWSLLHVASSSRVGGDRAACVNALLAHKCNVDAIASGSSNFIHNHNGSTFSYENSTPLMFAAQNGRVETIKALVKGRADINARSGDGGTALHVAAAHLQLEAAKVLIDSGIDGTITSGVEVAQTERDKRRKRKQKRKQKKKEEETNRGVAPRDGKQNSDGEDDEDDEENEDDGEQAPQFSSKESAQYGSGLTAAQVAAATRDAAVVAQDLVDFSLDGFALCGRMKDEADLAEEIYKLLSAMRVEATKPVPKARVAGLASQNSDTESLGSDDSYSDSDSEVSGGGNEEEEVGDASPAR